MPSKTHICFAGWIRNFIICIWIGNSLHKENRGLRRRAGIEAHIRQTIVCMQMLSNFCQHVPMYNQATGKWTHSSHFFVTKRDYDYGGKYQKILNFQAQEINLTQNLHQRLTPKQNHGFCVLIWFSRWEITKLLLRRCLGVGGRMLCGGLQPGWQRSKTLSLRSNMCINSPQKIKRQMTNQKHAQ